MTTGKTKSGHGIEDLLGARVEMGNCKGIGLDVKLAWNCGRGVGDGKLVVSSLRVKRSRFKAFSIRDRAHRDLPMEYK